MSYLETVQELLEAKEGEHVQFNKSLGVDKVMKYGDCSQKEIPELIKVSVGEIDKL